jgi:type I restriction enzyme M protein
VRRAHVTETPHRHLLRPGRQSQRPLLRPQTRQPRSLDQNPLDLRPPHEHALHPQNQRADLDDFVAAYRPANRHDRTPTWTPDTPDGLWRPYPYEDLVAGDKVSLDLFWLKDDALESAADLADPDLIAAEIVEDLRAALEEFDLIATDLAAPSADRLASLFPTAPPS